MSVVKHVKHSICIHPYWFCRREGKRERREEKGGKEGRREGP